MISKLIFGLGTGRCGTWTLSKVFAAQKDVGALHENVPLPWKRDEGLFAKRVLDLAINIDDPIVASVSYVWINYVGLIMGTIKDPRCICLKRPMDQVVESFLAHSPNNNHWTDPTSPHWRPTKDTHTTISYQWPKYDLPKAEALEAYWKEYYAKAEYLADRYPDNFMIIDMEMALNDMASQREMLAFAGIDYDKQVFILDQKLNALHKPKGEPAHV